jgi:Asp-tRNA(Asn)/Glu-tRNA(Gln) amidotransferase A subunit family amidase
VVVQRLADAGAVLVAKLSLGALAYGDIWYGGRTNNPWNTAEGSSGSSAGSAAATAAGLVGFSLGTETLGSIVSPSMRCGTTGLRPTFGRVPRTGAMALCWSLDKIGPICRNVEDCALVLAAIHGEDPGDVGSLSIPLSYDGRQALEGLKVGYRAKWFEGNEVNRVDRTALQAMRRTGVRLVEIDLPELPYDALLTELLAEAAAAFEPLTLSNRDDELTWQDPEAWPNSFRQARFISAIDLIQASRLRREVMGVMAEVFDEVDAIIGPSYADPMLLVTNCTGHPSITLRAGFERKKARRRFSAEDEDAAGTDKAATGEKHEVPYGVTLWGGLFDEGTLCRIALALEAELAVWDRRPPVG